MRVKLSTNNLTKEENLILQDILITKYKLDCRLREILVNDNILYHLYITKNSMSDLILIVKPFRVNVL